MQGKNLINKRDVKTSQEIDQGDCVHIHSSEDLFQVIGIDDVHKRCWVRRWPLMPKGSPVFEIPIQQVSSISTDRIKSLKKQS
tara:strand:+ start:715 stop:963 length:249 start_codon:yes stop_codon:yes gene_type:complete